YNLINIQSLPTRRYSDLNVPMTKQFILLNEKPIIVHTVEKFILNNSIEKIIIATPKEWVNHTNNILKKYKIDLPKIEVITGGSEDRKSIRLNSSHFSITY